MRSIASTHKSFSDVLEWEEYFAFLLNLPIAARYASMDIIMGLKEVTSLEQIKFDVRNLFTRVKKI